MLTDTSVADAPALAQHICEMVAGCTNHTVGRQGNYIGEVTLRLGSVAVGSRDDSLEQLMERADGALYQAKRYATAYACPPIAP